MEKPYPTFPLTWHPSGIWCKKVRGKLYYFGKEPTAALDEWLRVEPYLKTGRTPPAKSGSLTIGELARDFLIAQKKRRVDDKNSITENYVADCTRAVARLVGVIDHLAVEHLTPQDFQTLMDSWPKTWNATTRKKQITLIRQIFSFANEQGLLDKPIRFGSFKSPSKKEIRLAKSCKKQVFSREEILQVLDKSDKQLKCMILLAISCGLGNTDLAELPVAVVNGEWINYARTKTGIDRKLPLWKEVKQAINDLLETRKYDHELLFHNRQHQPFNLEDISQKFKRVRNQCGIKAPGFYGLRHTFATVASETGYDRVVKYMMGHSPTDMTSYYVHGIKPALLQEVSNYVHDWLYGTTEINEAS